MKSRKPKSAPADDLQPAVDAAWQLVETAGLSEAAFDHASIVCIRDALWLIAHGTPVAQVVQAMNEQPYAGRNILRAWRRRRTAELKALDKQARRQTRLALSSADLAALLARMNVGALLAELHALLLTEESQDKVRRLFVGVLRLHQAVRESRYPDAARSALRDLKPPELQAVFLNSAQALSTIRTLVGEATIHTWLRP